MVCELTSSREPGRHSHLADNLGPRPFLALDVEKDRAIPEPNVQDSLSPWQGSKLWPCSEGLLNVEGTSRRQKRQGKASDKRRFVHDSHELVKLLATVTACKVNLHENNSFTEAGVSSRDKYKHETTTSRMLWQQTRATPTKLLAL